MEPAAKKHPRMEVMRIDVDTITPDHEVRISIERQDVICWYSGTDRPFQIMNIPGDPFYRPFPSHSTTELCSGPAKQDAERKSYKYAVAPEGGKPIDPTVIIQQ